MKNVSINFFDSKELQVVELLPEESQSIEGGILDPFSATVAIGASLLYAYEWGYNYAKARL